MPVSGALTQLAAQGPQNRYLTIDPQVTFWKGTYKRHSMFAVAEIDNTFQGATGGGRKMTALINRSGDLCHRVYFYFQMKPIQYAAAMPNDGFTNNVAYYTNSVGHAAIESVNFEIGGHTFDSHTGEYLELWEQLTAQPGKRLGEQVGQADSLDQLIEYGKKTQHIYVPLQFDWNRQTERALPLIALQYHDVKINVRTRQAEQLIVRSGEANNPATLAQAGDMCDMTLIVNYVFLDAMERRMFAQQMHEYLMDEVQSASAESRAPGVASMQIRLNFNHPVSEYFWVVQRDAVLQPVPYSGAGPNAGGGGNDWFNFSGNYDPTTGVVHDPIVSAGVYVNGHERTMEHPAVYYRQVHPREKHSSKPIGFVYNYAYALHPEELQPSGTSSASFFCLSVPAFLTRRLSFLFAGSMNHSRIDNVILKLVFPTVNSSESEAAAAPFAAQVRVYGRNLNIRRIVSGMVRDAYLLLFLVTILLTRSVSVVSW